MEKKTILYIGGFELPNLNAAAHRVISNGKILRNLGYEVVFLGVDKRRTDGALQRSSENYFGFECWSVPYPRAYSAWIKYAVSANDAIALVERKKADNCIAVICYNHPALVQLRIWWECRKRGMKHLADATEWYDASGGGFLHRLVKFFDTQLRMHAIHRLADGIITTSLFLTDFYQRRGKITLELPTLFDTSEIQCCPTQRNSEFIKYIYVGNPFDVNRVNKHKSNLKERLDKTIELFFELHRSARNFRFDIYGLDRSAYVNVFPEHVSILDELGGKVRFHGKVENAVVRKLIAACDFSIFLRDETRVTLSGFPSKAAESISCGTPVITNSMQSLERYRTAPGVLMANCGTEYNLLEQCDSLSHVEIMELKQKTYQSRTFDYRQFISQMSDFLKKLGLR